MYGGMREPSGTEGVTAGTESEFFHRFGYFCLAVRVSWARFGRSVLFRTFSGAHMVGIQNRDKLRLLPGFAAKRLSANFFCRQCRSAYSTCGAVEELRVVCPIS